MPPITPYFVMKVGHVPLIPYHRPGDPAVADLVAGRIGQMRDAGTPIRAVMLDRLGPARVAAKLAAEGRPLPKMLAVLQAAGADTFYRADGAEYLGTDGRFHAVPAE